MALAIAVTVLLLRPGPAFAAVNIFTVNSPNDGADSNTADNVCNTGGLVNGQPECTLRAAIMQANATANTVDGPDEVRFAIDAVL